MFMFMEKKFYSKYWISIIINKIVLSEEKENNLCDIIMDNEIIERIKTKKITSFSYPL